MVLKKFMFSARNKNLFIWRFYHKRLLQVSKFNLTISVFQIGKTKVFLRAGQMAELDARRAEVLSSAANTIQRRARTHIARKQFISLRRASISLQSVCRGETLIISKLE